MRLAHILTTRRLVGRIFSLSSIEEVATNPERVLLALLAVFGFNDSVCDGRVDVSVVALREPFFGLPQPNVSASSVSVASRSAILIGIDWVLSVLGLSGVIAKRLPLPGVGGRPVAGGRRDSQASVEFAVEAPLVFFFGDACGEGSVLRLLVGERGVGGATGISFCTIGGGDGRRSLEGVRGDEEKTSEDDEEGCDGVCFSWRGD